MAELRKGIGLAGVFCIASGAMISSGLFVLPGLAHARAGPAVVVSYLLAGLLAATGLLSTAELATAMPKAGSDYFFITRGIGPAAGTVAGLFNWVSFSLKSAFALVGMGAFVRLFAPIDLRVTGVALGLGFVGLNLVGVREAARVQLAMVGGLLVLMLLYVAWGLPAVNAAHHTPFAPHGAAAVFSTAGFVFVSFGGLLKIASVAEEVRDPGRTIPRAMVLSLVVTTALYALMVFITVGVVPARQLNGSLTPIADGAMAFMGRGGQVALGVAGALAFLTTANAGIMTGSRYLLAMGRDGLLPSAACRVGRRFQTPHVAILVTGGLVILPLFVDLHVLVESASIGLILTNILANVSVVLLRESGLQNYRPVFRSPLYPWVQVAGTIGFVFVLFEMGVEAFAISALLAVAGFCLYWFYGRARAQKDSALLHLVQRITARELVTGTLEAELKQIIRQRDEIVLDRFDGLVEGCLVLDTDDPLPADELFDRAAARLAERMGIDRAAVYEALRARERESSTVIAPGLAVPHVVVAGEGVFEVLLARSRQGFVFGPQRGGVRAVFVLAGSRDERNFHLQALSAIAQVVQEPDFEKRWLAARDEQGLRDLVLLGQRRRH
ncbi:MAG TPA: amino acid permease [Phycisphaerae bacterium]|nr:amino acid permease [Phycisphaerae bacterium]